MSKSQVTPERHLCQFNQDNFKNLSIKRSYENSRCCNLIILLFILMLGFKINLGPMGDFLSILMQLCQFRRFVFIGYYTLYCTIRKYIWTSTQLEKPYWTSPQASLIWLFKLCTSEMYNNLFIIYLSFTLKYIVFVLLAVVNIIKIRRVCMQAWYPVFNSLQKLKSETRLASFSAHVPNRPI